MSCSWCGYSLNLVYPHFTGYQVFNGYGGNLGFTMCSLNCCVAQIYRLDVQVEPRLEYLYDYYGIAGRIEPARDKSKLTVNGGTLSYSQFRQNFICPPTSESEYYEEEAYEDYEFEDDPYRY